MLKTGISLLIIFFGLSNAAFGERRGMEDRYFEARQDMVERQLLGRDIRDKKVLKAMRKVPREEFLPSEYREFSYIDSPVGIGEGQTISQPYIVALMTQLLELAGEEKVLEIGTGSGYQAAVLAEIVQEVYTIEIIPALANRAQETLRKLKYKNVRIKVGDGYKGWPEYAPYDAIIVTAAPPEIPRELVNQLKAGGKMIVPVGVYIQELILLVKTGEGIKTEKVIPVRFVPMVRGSDGGMSKDK